jgi:glycosyltransferase involved in cell wall biosynthesis
LLSELQSYYSHASVFYLVSIQDGYGMVIPQAMACQLPAIFSSNTAGEDIVRNGIDSFVVPI